MTAIDKNYWPNPLQQMAAEQPLQEHCVLVAQISRPWNNKGYRHIYTALISPSLKESIMNRPGGIGHEVTTTGPHPSPYKGSFEYIPKFSIWAAEMVPEGLEPLVVAWTTGRRTVLAPNQGFLMTYGLTPRTVRSEHGDLIHWDDLQKPSYDVVIAKMVSEYYFDLKSEAYIQIDRQYLRDYATVRNKSLVQVYYATNTGPMSQDDRKALSGKNIKEFKIPGRLLDVRLDSDHEDVVIAQVWGIRDLLDPLDSPVIEGRWEYGQLRWPGIEGLVTDKTARQLGLQFVYVSDSVLQHYEEHSADYSIYPESGSVSYQGQWTVSYCERLSRDIIRLEIRKLYEGCPPDVVKHWNRYAVDPPPGNPVELMNEPNVGSRSKRIVYALADLGDTLSKISYRATGKDLGSKDFVGLDRATLNYYGWWNTPETASIARHIPLDIGEKEFLERCKELNSLIVEGVNEGNVRRILLSCGMEDDKIKRLKALKLLDILVQHARISIDTGLGLIRHATEIENLRMEKIARLAPGQHRESPMSLLFVLYDLRIAAAHAGKSINALLVSMGTDIHSVRAGFGLQLDKFYDSIGTALIETTQILRQAHLADSRGMDG